MYGENAKDVMPRLSWNGKGPWRLTASRFAAAQRPVGKYPWGGAARPGKPSRRSQTLGWPGRSKIPGPIRVLREA